VSYLIAAFMGYLLGTSSMALYLSRLQKINLRAGGSGNLGASNTVQLMGWKAGVLVALHDIGKAVLAVLLAQRIFPDTAYIGAVAGICSVLGHIFAFYLKFKGGKGFASYFGMTVALNWKLGLVLFVLAVAVTFLTDYIVVGTVTTTLSAPIYLGWSQRDWILPCILLIASVVIWIKHRENFVRMYHGTEIGLMSAFKGEHRVKK
jgi:glycerol-3-phosphate acyltransferase PlsY